jgi:hypothetical protein
MLSEGKGGFGDYGEYRQRLTDYIFHGITPEVSPEDAVAATQAAVGGPTPQAAMDEARAMYEASKRHLEGQPN